MARIALGLVLAAAGALKIADRGAPAKPLVSERLMLVVAALEVALGVGLVAGVLRPFVAIAALALLAGFTVYVARALARPADERPRCACFGALSTKPVGPLTLARNLALIALGVMALAS